MPVAPIREMETNFRNALLVGATGLTGGHLLAQLLADRRYAAIHVLSRRDLPVWDSRLHCHVVDFDHIPSDHTAFRINDVYCCLGTTLRQAGSRETFRQVDHAYPMMVARAALAGGAQRYVVMSALGATPHTRNFYLRTKGELERDLNRLAFQNLIIVRPSLLVGRRETGRFLEGLGIWMLPKLAFLLAGPLKPYRAISADTVARAMHRLAWQSTPGRRVVTSDHLQILGGQSGVSADG